MTEEKQAEQNKAQQKAPAAKKGQKTAQQPPKKRGGRLLWWLLLLLFLLCTAALAYLYWQFQQDKQHQQQQWQQLQQQISRLRQDSRQQQLIAQNHKLQQSVQQLRQQVQQKQQQLEQSLQDLERQVYLKQKSWIYADIHYLLQLAARRLTLAGDVHGAVAALRSADDAIRKVENAALIPLRKTIMDTIARVEGLEVPDLEGLLIRVENIRLQFLQQATTASWPNRARQTQTEGVTAHATEIQWKSSISDFFEQFFTVKDSHTKEAEANNLSGVQVTTSLPANTGVLLDFSRLKRAVLAGDQQQYDRVLARLVKETAKGEVYEKLQLLQGQQVAIVYPDASRPLLQYEQILLQMKQQELQQELKP